MKLLIDGVFFQFAESGIARVWSSILPILVSQPDLEVFILDRGGLPVIPGLKRIPFPTYREFYTADDSILIQRICDAFDIDVFTSTYYTTPLTTPTFLLVHDMIPEIMGFDLNHRLWRERDLAILFARGHIVVSQSTQKDLLRFYSELTDVSVAYLGYNCDIFKPVQRSVIESFKQSIGFEHRPYVIMVGHREQHQGYKNGRVLFEAIASNEISDFDVLCVGGEPEIAADILASMPPAVQVKRIVVPDADLVAAYGGASALVYPSLYEGFGLPVLEAMACGCPVITTARGSLAEVAGDACLTIDGTSQAEVAQALVTLQQGGVSERLRSAGLERARRFSWETLASTVLTATRALSAYRSDVHYQQFAESWSKLRRMQSEVDVACWVAGGLSFR